MDRQTERVNQELNQFLCLFVNEQQDDWYDLLSIAEFQHNNYVHSATQQFLFLCHDLAKWLSQYLYSFSFSFLFF